jgi:hypothetical protein
MHADTDKQLNISLFRMKEHLNLSAISKQLKYAFLILKKIFENLRNIRLIG